jgi:asparagine synthase (glutamine-hydrolysing)
MADDIRSHHPGAAIETLSFYDTDEPSGDERPYFELVEEKRGRKGHHISTSDFRRQTAHEALAPLPEGYFSAVPGYFAPSLRWASMIADIQHRAGATVTLSGLGGDELLGGVQYEAPELADHLIAGSLCSFSRSLYGWSLAKRKTIFQLLLETLQLLRASKHPESLVAKPDHPLIWSNLRPPTHYAALLSFTSWRRLTPSKLSMEWARYCLAEQLTAIDPPLVSCMERRYPYLDRSLFVFLASIPRTQVIQAGRRRNLMRRALRGIVPYNILFRKTKSFGFRRRLAMLRDQKKMIESMFAQDWVSDKQFLDKNIVWSHLEAIEQGVSSEGALLVAAIGLEHWLRSQQAKGVFEISSMPPQSRSRAHQPEIAVPLKPG